MGYYRNPETGAYYEGDKARLEDEDVPKRPDENSVWAGDKWEAGPPPVPDHVSMRQGREELIDRGQFLAVDGYFKSLPDTPEGLKQKNAWEKSQTIERHSPWTHQMIVMLGLTESQADQWFISANKR